MYLLLFALWLILNGKLTLEICLLGLGTVAAIGLIMYLLFRYTPQREWRLYKKVPLFLVYIVVLLKEILHSSFSVLRLILNKRQPASPALVTFTAGLHTRFGRYMLANSITLTPGTITVRVEGDRFTVHCLDEKMLDGIESSTFVRLLKRLEA